MKYNIFLDDRRTPMSDPRVASSNDIYHNLDWMVVINYDEFINAITKFGLPEVISFDHDLADEHIKQYFEEGGHDSPPAPAYDRFVEKTGKHCADWLIDYCVTNNLKLPTYYVHSANPAGKANIISLLHSAKKHLNL